MKRLIELSRRLPAARGQAVGRAARFGPDRHVSFGAETRARSDADRYDWRGDARGDPGHPTAIFQYTLAGHGAFAAAGVARRVPAGSMFAAVFPSAHRYYLPDDATSWTFVWFVVRQPYVVERVRARVNASGPVVATDPDGPLVTTIVGLFDRLSGDGFPDVFAWERATFDLLFEWERACEHRAHPRSPRDKLLDETRAAVLRDLSSPPDVARLARARDMSRTGFSHHFKATTGLSPAQFVTDVQLQEVARRLQQTDDKLAALATACGFADANHLCKVFRRHYHTSPGEYRRQFR